MSQFFSLRAASNTQLQMQLILISTTLISLNTIQTTIHKITHHRTANRYASAKIIKWLISAFRLNISRLFFDILSHSNFLYLFRMQHTVPNPQLLKLTMDQKFSAQFISSRCRVFSLTCKFVCINTMLLHLCLL